MVLTSKYLQSAATTGNGAEHDCHGDGSYTAFYVVPAGTIAGGTVQIETAETAGYTGTWAPLMGLVTLATGVTTFLTYQGPLNIVRARIATNVSGSGGSVSVRLLRSS